ncbi:MAG: hypothetical protein OHK005_08270 [Candidatus Methylacidiphilales bacterium]
MTLENALALVMRETAAALGRNLDSISPTQRFVADLGAESIDFIDLTFRLEKATGRTLSETELFKPGPEGDRTIQEVAARLAALP